MCDQFKHGHVHLCFREMVLERFGRDTLMAILYAFYYLCTMKLHFWDCILLIDKSSCMSIFLTKKVQLFITLKITRQYKRRQTVILDPQFTYIFITFTFRKEGFDGDNDFMLFHYYDDKRTNDLVVAISKITGENKWARFTIVNFHKYIKSFNTKILLGSTIILVFLIGLNVCDVWKSFGNYFFNYASKLGYDRMLRSLGMDFYSFVQNLDHLHSLLALTYKGMRPPHFRYISTHTIAVWLLH